MPLNRRPTARARVVLVALLTAIVGFAASPIPALAQPGGAPKASGLPVPRFVSLKAKRVNVRVGPGQDYGISWIFTRIGLPVEVIQEFDTWRRVRDSDGSVGWVFHSLLSGKRTGVVAPWGEDAPIPIRRRPDDAAAVTAYLESGVVGDVRTCRVQWCRINGKGYDGWIRQDRLWGVYPDETVD